MCGIAGIFNFNSNLASKENLVEMLKNIKHRGPDDEGVYINENIALGHVRLSILDLSESGHQPMFSNDNRYCIVYNGELFNYLEIRKNLESKYIFKTGTDTEVILAAYQEWGEKCLDQFNGMWAFALYDIEKKSLFVSRDRFGVKPLYYFKDKDSFIFSSEIKALYSILKEKLSVDYKTIYEFLVYGRTDQTCDTFIKEIKRFQHGCSASLEKDNFNYKVWYNLTEKLQNPWKSPEEYREYFASSVNIRLRSDVPVGVCLSGGLDSSAVTSTILNDFNLNELFTFSAVYGEGKHGDESNHINLYKSKLKNLTYVYPTEETFLNDFDSFMDCHFEPVPTLSIYSQFKLIKDASKFVTVALDGQGADEQLGGYHYFFSSYFRGLFREFRWLKLLSEVIAYTKEHKSLFALKYLAFYFLPKRIKGLAGEKKLGWLNETFAKQYSKESKISKQLFNPKSLNQSLIQHFEYKLEHNLKWNDLNSMYFSVELRAPFMDYRLVERTLALNADKIIHKGYTKHILREAMKGTLPEQIRLRQDKVGFENPSEEWMRTPLIKNLIEETLSSDTFLNSGIFDVKKCREKYNLHQEGKINISHDLWKWVNVNHFLKKFNNA